MKQAAASGAQDGAVGGGPATFGADDDGGRRRGAGFERGEVPRAFGFVEVQRDGGRGARAVGKGGGEEVVPGDGGEVGIAGLGGAGEEVTAPLASGPEAAGGVVGIGALGCDKVDTRNAHGRRIAQDVSGGLGAGESDDERGAQWRCGGGEPGEGEVEGVGVARCDHCGAAGAVYLGDLKRFARGAAQHLEEVPCAGVVECEGGVDFGDVE